MVCKKLTSSTSLELDHAQQVDAGVHVEVVLDFDLSKKNGFLNGACRDSLTEVI